ncbi:MAG TPA: PDZ domain-containing protein, partial [Gemmatimonadota bacterium]|nr:PDZ domain-containing protein [Gemmatimonadota bacterium]
GAAAFALALLAPGARAQEAEVCPGGREPMGKLGIKEIRCGSGVCLRGFAWEDGRLITTFTTEPRVHAVEPPAARILELGDVIVAVDGKLSTTREAARRLARVEPGDRVRLRIRRDGTEREVTVTAIPSCDRVQGWVFALDPEAVRHKAIGELARKHLESFDWDGLAPPLGEGQVGRERKSFTFNLNDLAEALERIGRSEGFGFQFDTLDFRFDFPGRVEPPFELGLDLTCGFFCGWRKGADGEPVWRGQHPPRVARVIEGGPADRAGIRAGDVLLVLDGHSFVGEEGGQALGRLRPGRALALQYLKDGETLTTTTITPRAPTSR